MAAPCSLLLISFVLITVCFARQIQKKPELTNREQLLLELKKLEDETKKLLPTTTEVIKTSNNVRRITTSTEPSFFVAGQENFVHVSKYEKPEIHHLAKKNDNTLLKDKALWIGVSMGTASTMAFCFAFICAMYQLKKRRKQKLIDIQNLSMCSDKDNPYTNFMNESNNYSINTSSSDEFSSSEDEIYNATGHTSYTSSNSSFVQATLRSPGARVNLTSTPIKEHGTPRSSSSAHSSGTARPNASTARSSNSSSGRTTPTKRKPGSGQTTPTKQTYSANRYNIPYGDLPLSPLAISPQKQ